MIQFKYKNREPLKGGGRGRGKKYCFQNINTRVRVAEW
jgi:hypothetical protein